MAELTIDDYNSMKNSYTNQILNYNNSIKTNSEKIELLKTAKASLESAKETVDDLNDKWKYIYDDLSEDTYWEGDTREDLGGCMMYDIRGDVSTYYSNIDEVLDEICDKIYELETDTEDSDTIVSNLYSKIKWVENEIEKYFN